MANKKGTPEVNVGQVMASGSSVVSYMKEQVLATHSFINSFASMSEGQ